MAGPAEEKGAVDLADDLPPELEFQLVDAVNAHRRAAGLEPIFLETAPSRGCQAHAEYLARNPLAPTEDEDPKRPGFSEAGRAAARTADVAAEEPLAALEKALSEPALRAKILAPRLRTFGAGYARNVEGRWSTVFDWTGGVEQGPPMDATPVKGAVVYPAPAQVRVPLWFPGNETPDPIPDAKNKLAGFPVTLQFPPRAKVEAVAAKLHAGGDEIEVWLSSAEKPANPAHAGAQQNTVCLIARRPLLPNRRYLVEVSARVDGGAWSAKWEFATVCEGEIRHETAGTLLRTLNATRRRAGLRPVPLDPERSKACTAHALYLGANAPNDRALNWNEEKPGSPGYTAEGAEAARTASIQGGGGPVEAVSGLVDSLISRPQLLDPHLRALGLGYTPFAHGGWIWVMELRRGRARPAPGEVLLYPAPDQKGVPLHYPMQEVPSPVPPEGREKGGGYAITAEFAPGAKVTGATAKLVDDKGEEVAGWLSSPEKRAIADYPQRSVCLIPRAPLKPRTHYTVTLTAGVDGRPWERTWGFTTLDEPDVFAADLGEKVLARVNAVRRTAGLKPVTLDDSLSAGCQSHARYLALNARGAAVRGLAIHREDPSLPGATPEGARAGTESVIAVLLDPPSCVDGWAATLYHRIPLLRPDLERVGFGHARMGDHKWACVLDTGNGRRMNR